MESKGLESGGEEEMIKRLIMKCLVCDRKFEVKLGRNVTCSKKCARTYGHNMTHKQRKELREKKLREEDLA